MVLVKFASRCDAPVYESLTLPGRATPCNARSAEYTEWAWCRVCHIHVCPTHTFTGSRRESDGVITALCPSCGWKHRGEGL